MSPPPKICILTETFFPVVGGGETQAKALTEKLRDFGHQVIVVTRRSQASFKKRESFGDVVVYRLAPTGSEQLKKWWLLVTSVPALIKLRHQYDVIFVSGFRVIGISAVLVSKILGKVCILKADSLGEMSGDFFAPGLAAVHVPFLGHLFDIFLKVRNNILRKADGFVAISSAIAEELTAQNVPPSLVHCIPNSVDQHRFFPVNSSKKNDIRNKIRIPQEGKIVTYTGRLVSYKGLPGLLEVWLKLTQDRKDIRLFLLGSGSDDIHNCESDLRTYVVSNNMNETVCFAGSVDNIPEYLQASDVFVFPTENEAFGIALVEAMACGLAVISTQVGGLRDIIKDQYNGLVIEPGNREQLKNTLENLLDNADLAKELGEAAWHTVQERYTVELVTQKYHEYFNLLAQNKKRTANLEVG